MKSWKINLEQISVKQKKKGKGNKREYKGIKTKHQTILTEVKHPTNQEVLEIKNSEVIDKEIIKYMTQLSGTEGYEFLDQRTH